MNRELAGQYDRTLRLAKGLAKMEEALVAIYKDEDGTYGFNKVELTKGKKIVEYVTPY